MKKVFFLVNKISEFNFNDLLEKYISDCKVTIGENLPSHSEDYDLIVLWNYRKILQNVAGKKNIILFHGSDLPEGKGWAPIFNSIRSGNPFYVISGLFADQHVDSGDIIVKARFKIQDNYTAEFIRQLDSEISIRLIKDILLKFQGTEIKGKKQGGSGSFNSRRKPEDNEVRLNAKLEEIIDHLRACEKSHPAFFLYRGIKYRIHIEPFVSPPFPEDLEVNFYCD